MSKLPVLIKIFNRKDNPLEVVKALRAYKPERVYVDGDGGRNEAELKLVDETRKGVLEAIDWKCDVKTNFAPQNIGLKKSMSGAITWFFENEEAGIILEDDCVPTPSFFPYCETLLEKYANETSIMHISGCNFQPKDRTYPGSYYFSKYSYVWGWASWRRAWQKYQLDTKSYPEFQSIDGLSSITKDPMVRNYWEKILDKAVAGKLTTWDYQWTYSIWAHNGLSVNPSKNMIRNIGFGNDAATNTKGDSVLANYPTEELVITKHPEVLVPYGDADAYSFNFHKKPSAFKRVLRHIKYSFQK